MNTVKVKRDELRAIVQKNRDEHRGIFEQALDGYRRRVIEELERRLEDVKAGRQIDQYLRLAEPTDHTKEYDRVLQMLEMSVDDEIELAAKDFGRYVMDDWDWKDQFITTSNAYGAGL